MGRRGFFVRALAACTAFFMVMTGTAGAVRSDEADAAETDAAVDLIRDRLMTSGDMIDHINQAESMQLLSSEETAEIDRKMAAYQAPAESLMRNKAETYYYYEHLEGEAKQIYDVLLTVASDPETIDNYGLLMTTTDPSSEEFFFSYSSAYWSLVFDHPELFWLYNSTEISIYFGSDGNSMNGIYLVYFGQDKEFTAYEEMMTAFNDAADAFLSDIDTSGSEYDTVRQIHDKLIHLVTYDYDVADGGDDSYSNLAHTAYGALVCNSEGTPNYAVCDGYSLALEYLLQQCGIEVVFNAGRAGASEFNAGGHAWDLVRIDGNWYEIDATWDDTEDWDQDFTPADNGYEYIMEALHDELYSYLLQHYLFLISTEDIRNFEPSDSMYFTTSDGATFTLLGESVHIRFVSDGTKSAANVQAAVLSTAPEAVSAYTG